MESHGSSSANSSSNQSRTPGNQDFMEESDDEGDLKATLISLVQKHRFIYDLRHEHHKDKGKTEKAWEEISKELGETADWCKNRWKHLKQYYLKVKTKKRGRSGQGAKGGSTWVYFKSMSFLDGVKDDNENTISNLNRLGVDSDPSEDNVDVNTDASSSSTPEMPLAQSTEQDSTRVDGIGTHSTPKGNANLPIKKRSMQMADEVNMKIIDYLNKQMDTSTEESSEEKDEVACWARMAAARLRRLPQHVSMATMMKCDKLIFDALNPMPMQYHNHNHSPEPYNYTYNQISHDETYENYTTLTPK